MYWLARPPYLRWLTAALIIAAGLWFEIVDRAEVQYPFLTSNVAAGAPIGDADIEWRSVPGGFTDVPAVAGRSAAIAMPAGTPIVEAMLTSGDGIPDDWWAVALPLPLGITTGAVVRIILTSTGEVVPGRVVAAAADGGFGFDDPGLVAVPEAMTGAVAVAASSGDLTIITRP